MKGRTHLQTGATLAVLLLAAVGSSAVAYPTPPQAQPPATATDPNVAQPPATMPERFNRALQLLESEDYRAADTLLRQVIDDPQFPGQPERFKAGVYLVAGYTAKLLEESDRAWGLLDKAMASPGVDADIADVVLDSALETWRPEKAIAPMQLLAAKSPDKLRARVDREISALYGGLKQQKVPDADLVAFVQALFDANWLPSDGREPSMFWRYLAERRLMQGNQPAAIAAARRIRDARDLLALQVDRRFDAVVAALDPSQRDLAQAHQKELEVVVGTFERNPRQLSTLVQQMYLMLDVGSFEQVLQLCDATLDKVARAPKDQPLFDDQDDELIWIHDQRARALLGLGRVDEAVAVWDAARKMQEGAGGNVSQQINAAVLFGSLGRRDDALRALSEVAADNISPYGSMQYHAARVLALLDEPDDPRVQESMKYLRDHREDSQTTYLSTLLDTGDLDAASAVFRELLADPDTRLDALLDAQQYLPERFNVLSARSKAHYPDLVKRPEVQQAIEAVGRVMQVPLRRTVL